MADLISGQLSAFCQGGIGGLKKDPLIDDGLVCGCELTKGLPQVLVPLQLEQEPERVLTESAVVGRTL